MRGRRRSAKRDPGDAGGVLRAEHEIILSVARALGSVLQGGGRLDDVAFWSEAVGFLQAFAEWHDTREEEVLLPHFSACGVATTEEPFVRLLAEHDEVRALLQHMAELAPRLADASPTEREAFRAAVAGYCELIPRHIAAETGVLLPLMDELISPEDARDLMQRFRLREHTADGEDEYDRLLTIADHLRRAA